MRIKNLISELYLTVDVHLGEEGNIYHFLLLKRNGDKLNIIEKEFDERNIENVKKYLGKGTRVILSINGKGVLIRKASIESGSDAESLISQILPNAHPDDFISNINIIDDENALICLARKDLVKGVVELFYTDQSFILDVMIGPLQIEQILPLIGYEEQKLYVGNYKFLLQDGKIIDCALARYHKGDFLSNIGGEEVNEKLLIPFAGCFSHIINGGKDEVNLPEIIYDQRKDIKFFKLFTHGSMIAGGLLFLALLINFFLFDAFNNKNLALSSEVSSFEGVIHEMEVLQENISMKKELVKEAGFLEQSKYSFYADRLITCMPAQIILDELSVFPASQDKRSKKLLFVQGIISIKGELHDPSALNEWIKNLQNKDWISEIQVVQFDHNSRSNTSYFEIEISLS